MTVNSKATESRDVPPTGAERLRFEGLTLDLAGRALSAADGREIALTRAEFELLSVLIRSRGRALSRDQCLDAVAGRHPEPFDRTIDVLISRLRHKIEPEPKAPRLFLTVPGHGYKFAAKLVQVAREQDKPAVADELPAAPASPTAERRLLTVLVCSLSIATESSVRLAPEERHGVVKAFRTCCSDISGRFGGVLGPVAGDTVHIYFGHPAAHEHDIEQAIRAGLAVVATVQRHDLGLAVLLNARVGIATGEAVADNGRLGEVSGEPPALAQKLAASAASGTVLLGAATRRLAGALFEYRALSAAEGMPPESFQVLGEATVATRFDALHPGELRPLVGRREEVGLLLGRWHRAQAGSGNVVLLSGEPGIGKSRLVRELRSHLAGTAHIPLICYCAPHQRDSPYHPFIQHLEHAAGFTRFDDAGKRLNKLKALLVNNGSDLDALALFADLLSIPTDASFPKLNLSPQQRRDRTIAALVDQVVAAARAPVLLVFEDAHWMDRTSLEVVDTLVDRITDLPVLLIVTFRPEFTAPWTSHPQTTVLVLNRLDCSTAKLMVDEVSGGAMPESLSRRIIAQADGVPLFLEELTKTMLEGGAEAGTSLPASLHDSLMERLDRLPAAKRVAQLGAAIGRSFPYDLAARLSETPEKELCFALDQLVSSALIARHGSPPDAKYTFKHALVQTAAYESMLKSQRTAIHGKIVEVLLALERDIEDSQPDLLAYHCELANLVEKAAAYYIQAGWRSNYHAAYADSSEQFRNALRLAATLPEGKARDLIELRALRGFGLTLGNIEGYASASFGAANLQALELCERAGQPAEYLGINFGVATFQSWRSDLPDGLNTAERLLSWGQSHGDIRGSILGELIAGKARAACGELAAARRHLQRALQLSESSCKDPAAIWTFRVAVSRSVAMYHIHSFLSRVLCWMGYPEQALTHSSAAVEQREEEVVFVADPMRFLQLLWIMSVLGDARDLVASAGRMAQHCRHHRLPMFAAVATIMHGYGIAHSGQPEAGQTAITDGLAAYFGTGAVRDSSYYRTLLAETCRMMGEPDTALSILSAALEETARTGEKCYDAELHRGIGEAHRQRADFQAAEQSFRQALAIARDQGARLWELKAVTSYAHLLRDHGDRDQAHALLAPNYAWFTEGFNTAPLRRASTLLNELEAAISSECRTATLLRTVSRNQR